MKTELKALDACETEAWANRQGLEGYRSRQIRHWLLNRLAYSFDEMTDLPKKLRAHLGAIATIRHLDLVETRTSSDGTRKYLFRLSDGLLIESVLIPERGHYTLCISSQCGCNMGCRFCMTGRLGLQRNLTSGEILDQVILVKSHMESPHRLTNIVFMGMGEPLANYDAVIRAVHNMTCSDGMNLSHRKVTVSTCGLVPQIRKLGRDVRVNLAVSLNAADNPTRSFLMPVNRTYPLADLLRACRDFPLPNRRMITFEYVLIRDINDSDQDARRLAGAVSGMRAKINLILLNPSTDLQLSPPEPDRVFRFQETLLRKHITVIVRKSKGSDIHAACGQLVASEERLEVETPCPDGAESSVSP
jgi:23S rRNA (adenine2503-C2)-methyltransferase